jgi:hypothetical protein
MSWSVGRLTVIVGDEVMGDSRTSVDLRDMRFLQVAMHNSSGCIGSFEYAAEGRNAERRCRLVGVNRSVPFDRVGALRGRGDARNALSGG